MGNCITCTHNYESSSDEFLYHNRKRTNNKIKQELIEKQIRLENLRKIEEFRESRKTNKI